MTGTSLKSSQSVPTATASETASMRLGSKVRTASGFEGEIVAIGDGQAAVRLVNCRTLTVCSPVADLVALD